MISAILFISFFIFLILGVPIGICLGLSSVCAILYSGTSLTIVATNMYSGISKFLLLAIPFFVLSGNIMAKAGISKRLIKFVDTCVGHKKGGIAIVCVIVACFFGAISGSGPATVAALGAVLIPAMVEQGGFSAPFSTALMATSSSIAIVIPPSIAFVVYASIRYRTRSSYGRGTGNRSNAGSKETQHQTIQRKSLRQRTLGRF